MTSRPTAGTSKAAVSFAASTTSRVTVCALALFLATCCVMLTGCAGLSRVSAPDSPSPVAGMHGRVHGGQQPVTIATIQLYAVGTTGDGSAPTALLKIPVATDLSGSFNITDLYTCPSSTTLVYIVSTGGNPGLALGTNNTAIVLMAALGQCGSLTASTNIVIDEVTTVAAAAALAHFTTPPYAIGSSSSDAGALAAAFANATSLADVSTGTSPGVGQNASNVPVTTINTLANILATCVNSASSTSSTCAALFSLTGSPSDVLSAAVILEQSPSSYNTNAIYALSDSTGPFQPQLTAPPASFAIGSSISTSSISASPGNVTIGSTVVLTSLIGPIFTGLEGVKFGSVSASGSYSATQITATVPSGAPLGTVNGTVTTTTATYAFIVNIYNPSGAAGVTLPPSGLAFPSQTVATESAP